MGGSFDFQQSDNEIFLLFLMMNGLIIIRGFFHHLSLDAVRLHASMWLEKQTKLQEKHACFLIPFLLE